MLTEYETTEREYADLMSKKDIVEKDKETLNAVIDELVQKKIEALNKAWAKVNGDFGSILTTLLPGNVAKLEPKPGCPVEEGLIIKVGLGEEGSGSILWKAGLNDLSGGQKSLIALSLVLSMCFRLINRMSAGPSSRPSSRAIDSSKYCRHTAGPVNHADIHRPCNHTGAQLQVWRTLLPRSLMANQRVPSKVSPESPPSCVPRNSSLVAKLANPACSMLMPGD